MGTVLTMKSQTVLSDFESVTLPNQNNHVYNDSLGGGGFSSGDAYFPTVWDNVGGYWLSGWAASNMQDSTTSGYANEYGCAAYSGYANSGKYAVGTTSLNLQIKLSGVSLGKPVLGFYVCNSTLAYKSMLNGDIFAKKFGGPTGNDPDWFKLTVKRYYNDTLRKDSVQIYLADYRYGNNAQDYILKTWTWIDLRHLGSTDSTGFTDSLAFYLNSSDNGSFGMNTPGFFCLDNLITNASTNPNAIENYFSENKVTLYPNPATNFFEIVYQSENPAFVNFKMMDITGKELLTQNFKSFSGLNKFKVDTQDLPMGIYFVSLNVDGKIVSKKLIKQ